MALNQTITALATPPGEGGIGIIRISGPESFEIIHQLFCLKGGKKPIGIKDRYMNYGDILDEDDSIIDTVMMVQMSAPRTYTREDVAEIHCHGGMIPIRRILNRILACGARLSEPGEFTRRAFLNGRIDLAQAEGLMDFIRAKSEEAAKASFQQMQGSLSTEIREMRRSLLELLAHMEVTIDYPEEDIEEVFFAKIQRQLLVVLEQCESLLKTADQGKLIREGIKTVIIGKPNVGKSSLLNALLKENRAIVTEVPGTTRDVIEDELNIRGILVRIMDTAGIRDTEDIVERIGVERSKDLILEADLILLIVDASEALAKEDEEIIKQLHDRSVLVLLNKTDKPSVIDEDRIRETIGDKRMIKTSMIEGTGIREIEDFIEQMVFRGALTAKTGHILTNRRHLEALIHSKQYIKDALDAVEGLIPLDLVTIDIRSAIDAFGEITGESLTEDLLDKIFLEFCLGK